MKISPSEFYNFISSLGIDFFTGVPDSLLKEFCLCIDDVAPSKSHIITANEGNAIALAAGYHLATGSIPLVYMQNSGFGNAINPLLSLCDNDVYSIPMLLMMGWRGEPGVKDEPQHIKQGRIQLELLNTLNLPYEIISQDEDHYTEKIIKLIERSIKEQIPVCILIKKGTFDKFGKSINKVKSNRIEREEVLKIILDALGKSSIIVSTTGKTSREIFEIRSKNNEAHNQDFLTVGSMGHCSSIALGIALSKPNREVIAIDGDGAMLMHLGSLATISSLKPSNFKHVLLNNEVHESVGGQETAAKYVDLSEVSLAIGYNNVFRAKTKGEIKNSITELLNCTGPSLLEIKIKPGSRVDLGRPTNSPLENKILFSEFIQ